MRRGDEEKLSKNAPYGDDNDQGLGCADVEKEGRCLEKKVLSQPQLLCNDCYCLQGSERSRWEFHHFPAV